MLLRDLNRLKAEKIATKSPSLPPQPEQSDFPVNIEIDSSPLVIRKEEPSDNAVPPSQHSHGAPLADMGLPDSVASAINIKEENVSLQDRDGAFRANEMPLQPSASMAPVPNMDIKTDPGPGPSAGGAGTLSLAHADLNFTDMEFSLAPGSAGSGQQSAGNNSGVGVGGGGGGVPGPNVNQAAFNPPQPNTQAGTLGNNPVENVSTASAPEQPFNTAPNLAENQSNSVEDDSKELPDAAFDDIFTGDGQTDGMDFDFSLGDGMGGDTFDDLMNDRDDTFDNMEHGDYDANFFGLDKVEDA